MPAGTARGITHVIGLVGWSGSGKTTLLARLIPEFTRRGRRVSTVKHAHHHFDVDHAGKDSHTHRLAGATEVLIASARRFALMRELREEPEWPLAALLRKLTPVDLVIVEGFKSEGLPKIEVWRTATGKPPLFPGDILIRGVLSDDAVPSADRPVVPLADIGRVADLLERFSEPLDSALARLG